METSAPAPDLEDKDAPLKAHTRLLGRLLGDVISAQRGETTFDKVESIGQPIHARLPGEKLRVVHQQLVLPDPEKRHVFAAAIAGQADPFVAINLQDFPEAVLAQHGIEARHPHDFLVNQL